MGIFDEQVPAKNFRWNAVQELMINEGACGGLVVFFISHLWHEYSGLDITGHLIWAGAFANSLSSRLTLGAYRFFVAILQAEVDVDY